MRNIKTVIEASKGAKTLYIMGIMLIVWKEPLRGLLSRLENKAPCNFKTSIVMRERKCTN